MDDVLSIYPFEIITFESKLQFDLEKD